MANNTSLIERLRSQETDLTALREELNSDLLDVERAKTEFLESQNLTGFRAEIARGFADAFSDDFEVDPMEVADKTQQNIAEMGDDKRDLLDSVLGGETNEKDWWDWSNPEDAAGHLGLYVFGALYNTFEGSFIGDALKDFGEKIFGISEKREAICNQLFNPSVVLGSLQQKLRRAEEFGLPLQNDQINLGVITGLLDFLNGNEELLQKYENIDASNPSAVAQWWEEALQAYSEVPGNPNIDIESDFVQNVIAVFTGEAAWSEVLINADIDELSREIEGVEIGDIENRDYGEMVPFAGSEIDNTGESIFGHVEDFMRDNGELLAVASATVIPVGSTVKSLIGMDSSAYSDPNSEIYLMFADLPFDAENGMPMSEIFEVMALFEKMQEDGETIMIPADSSQFAQYIKDKATLAGPRYSHLASMGPEKLNQVSLVFTGGIQGAGDKIMETTQTVFGNACMFVLDFMGSDEQEFLINENREGVRRLSIELRKKLRKNPEAINHIRDDLLPMFVRSENITFAELDRVLNPKLGEAGFRLERDQRGYIWLQEKITGTNNWDQGVKLLVDADHPHAEGRAQELTESGNFASAMYEGLTESMTLGLGEVRDNVISGNWVISGLKGSGLFITEATTGAVIKVLPFHYITRLPDIFNSEDRLTVEDVGVTTGNTMATFIVLRLAGAVTDPRNFLPWRFIGGAFLDTIEGVNVMRKAVFAPKRFAIDMEARFDLYRSRYRYGMRSVFNSKNRRIHQLNRAKYQLRKIQQLSMGSLGSRDPLGLFSFKYRSEMARLINGNDGQRYFERPLMKDGKQVIRNGQPAVERIRFDDFKRLGEVEKMLDDMIRAEGGKVRAPKIKPGGLPKARGRGIGRGLLILGSLAVAGAAGQEMWNDVAEDRSRGPESETAAQERDITLPEKREVYRSVSGGATTGNGVNEYQGIWDLFKNPDFKDLTSKQYDQAIDTSIANHENLVQHLQTEIAENREAYFNYVLEQPGQTVEVAVPHDLPAGHKGFIRLKIKDGALVMRYADGGDLKRSFYEDVDAKESTGAVVGDLALRVAPVTGTVMDGIDTWKAVFRGDVKGALRSGAWTVVGLAADVLLVGGALTSWLGVGIPFAWAGGAIRGARAARVVAVATRHSGKIFAAMTGAELWHSIDRTLFDGDLTHAHTF